MTANAAENDFALFWIDKGIIFFEYKQDIIIDLEAAKKIVEDRIKCQQGKAYPAFADCRGLKEINRDGREYLAKQGSNLIKACALLSSSVVHRTIGNFYLSINKPAIPTKLFNEENHALAWLQQFVES